MKNQSITPAGQAIYPSKLVAMKQISGRISGDCIEWRWQSERGGIVRCQRSIDSSARGAGARKPGHSTILIVSSARGLESRATERFHVALGISDAEASPPGVM